MWPDETDDDDLPAPALVWPRSRIAGGPSMTDARMTTASGRAGHGHHERLHVLVVDDDLDVREAIADALQLRDIDASVAADGAEALRRLRIEPLPDVVLLDLRMPVMDGEAFLIAQRLVPAIAAIPVVLHTSERDERTLARLGLAYLLRKPCTIETLLSTVRTAAARARDH
jgi:two-component system chemotaxis response regulator CheY